MLGIGWLLVGSRSHRSFTWNENTLRDRLNRIRLLQGRLLGRTDGVPNQASQDDCRVGLGSRPYAGHFYGVHGGVWRKCKKRTFRGGC
jgi:hypothetical protein